MTRILPATSADLPAVMNVLDAAMLDVTAETIRERIRAGEVLVAADANRIIGACVLAPRDDQARVEAIAIRPRRRGSGLGTSLIEAATARYGRLTAEFDPAVRPFYERLGFDVHPTGDQRYRGVRE